MARQRKPLKLSEVNAIQKAEAEWLRWREIDALCQPDLPDKQAYTKLKKASKMMAEAVDLFLDAQGSREMASLLATLQGVQHLRAPQSHYRAMLESMVEPLQLLGMACDQLGGRGGRLDPAQLRWVGIAADAWLELGNPTPTPKGRFFRSLTETPKAKSIPAVTEERTREALAFWRKTRRLQAG